VGSRRASSRPKPPPALQRILLPRLARFAHQP
jgi:hypothetical protein